VLFSKQGAAKSKVITQPGAHNRKVLFNRDILVKTRHFLFETVVFSRSWIGMTGALTRAGERQRLKPLWLRDL
jgi:hypothetical protein